MCSLRLLLALLLVLAAPAVAEVNVDLHALDALPDDAAATPQHPARHKPHKPAKSPPAAAKLPTPPPVSPAPRTAAPATPPPAPPAATLPTAAPPTASIPPVAAPPPPATPPAPPPPPPIVAGATSAASAIPGGLRVAFDQAGTDLSPASAEQIKALVQTLPAADAATIEVLSYAAGTAEDPSTARRLSLSRALAVRSALIADGVTASRIYVRALGSQPGDGPADRVDLTVLGDHAGTKPQAQ